MFRRLSPLNYVEAIVDLGRDNLGFPLWAFSSGLTSGQRGMT